MPHDFLVQAIDEYMDWLTAWLRLAFTDCENRSSKIEDLRPPDGFLAWRKNVLSALPQDQPSIEKLVVLHDQLHTLSRLILIKTPEHQVVSSVDFESFIAKYQEFIRGLRRFENAFATAASSLDVLTGLRSRLGLREDLERELARCKRSGKSFCVAIMDVDYFKKVNDVHGHGAGDCVLEAIANHISRGIRSFDDAYRFGGEEFLLCLKEADMTIGLTVLERLRIKLERTPVLIGKELSINVTASFGMVVSLPDLTLDDMLLRADQALYRAKSEGRNCIKMG